MTDSDVFEAWASPASIWSTWARPTLLVSDPLPLLEPRPSTCAPATQIVLSQLPAANGSAALIVDLPGARSVEFAIAAASVGYRPIPLFNGLPGPSALIDSASIVRALRESTPALTSLTLSDHAPPSFLLDSARLPPHRLPTPGQFDNRWIVFPQDFPSPTFLKARGVASVVVVRDSSVPLGEDLRAALSTMQAAQLAILQCSDSTPAPPLPLSTSRPWRTTLHALLWRMGLSLHPDGVGGFGVALPIAATSSGWA